MRRERTAGSGQLTCENTRSLSHAWPSLLSDTLSGPDWASSGLRARTGPQKASKWRKCLSIITLRALLTPHPPICERGRGEGTWIRDPNLFPWRKARRGRGKVGEIFYSKKKVLCCFYNLPTRRKGRALVPWLGIRGAPVLGTRGSGPLLPGALTTASAPGLKTPVFTRSGGWNAGVPPPPHASFPFSQPGPGCLVRGNQGAATGARENRLDSPAAQKLSVCSRPCVVPTFQFFCRSKQNPCSSSIWRSRLYY